MPENYNDIDGSAEGAGQAPQVSEAAQEKFRDNLKKSQAAQKKANKNERKSKTQDNTLAIIISKLLQDTSNYTIVSLLVQLIENNTPSNFLLAILSLYFKEVKTQLEKSLTLLPENNITISQDIISNISSSVLPKNIQEQIKHWGDSIIQASQQDKEKIFETIIQAETWEIHPSLIALSAHIIVKFSEQNHASLEILQAKDFSQTFFQKFLEDLQNNE